MESDLKVICIESEAFYALIDKLVDRVKKEHVIEHDKWISKQEVKQMLRISSDTTLQKLPDEGKIRFSQQERKMIVYDRDSVLLFLEQNAKESF